MSSTARFQGTNPWTDVHPDYLNYVQLWDSKWYHDIYDSGYPSTLPKDSLGTVLQNNWAFYPVFPFVVKGLHAITGLDWFYLSPLVATLSGFLAIFVIYKLFRLCASHQLALWAVAFITFFPISPILQIPYAEATHLLFLALALYFLVKRKYYLLFLVIPFMCLSRPAGVPFAAVMFFHTIHRWYTERENFNLKARILSCTLTVYASFWALSWVFISASVTGVRSAYTETELAWRGDNLSLFAPWFQMGWAVLGPLGFFAPFLIFPLFFMVLYSRPFDILAFDMRTWCASYMLYLFAVLAPQTSTFRMLLPLFPMALGAVNLSKDRSYRSAMILMFCLLQIVWVAWLWDYTPLPGGGDWPP
ncbi:MAG: hypothetical protein QM632_00940 [Micrococcaceae bacterium]